MLKLFLCKKDIWLVNKNPDYIYHDIYEISKYLSFEKVYETDELIFKKGKKYYMNNNYYIAHVSNGVVVIANDTPDGDDIYYFTYTYDEKYLYFPAVFLPEKWDRKIKINKIEKSFGND